MHNTDFDFMCPPKPGHGNCHTPKPPIPQPPVPVCPPPHMKPENCLINPYNKICFNNKEEAIQLLSNKDLLAGQIAFAYYYDNCNAHGINAIAAVGNIKVGAPNILFDNVEDIKKWIDKLSHINKKQDEYLNKLRVDVDNALAKLSYIDNSNDKIDSLDESLASLIGTTDSLKDSLSNVYDNIDEINSSIGDVKGNIVELSELITKVEESIKDINGETSENGDSISALNSSINKWIDKHLSDIALEHTTIITDFDKKLSDISTRFSNSTDDVNNSLGNKEDQIYAQLAAVENKLTNTINNTADSLSEAFISADNVVKSELKQEITDNVKILNSSIDKLEQEVKNLSLKSDGVNTDINNAVSDLNKELSDKLDEFKVEAAAELGKIDVKLKEHESAFNSAIDALKNEYSADINDKLNDLHGEGEYWVNQFKIELETLKSAYNARFSTIEKSIDTKISEVKDEFEASIRKMNSQLSLELKEEQ